MLQGIHYIISDYTPTNRYFSLAMFAVPCREEFLTFEVCKFGVFCKN